MDTKTLSASDFASAAAILRCDLAAVRAVAEVESAGSGFLPDGRPQVLYEAHLFHRLTGGRYANARDRSGVRLSVAAWDRSLYGAAGAHQHDRLADAARLDAEAAHDSCSWGAFQILGVHAETLGYPSAVAMAAAHGRGAAVHLDGFCRFVAANPTLLKAIRNRDWKAFAAGYNGPGYAANKYDSRMAAAYVRWSAGGKQMSSTAPAALPRADRLSDTDMLNAAALLASREGIPFAEALARVRTGA